MEGLLLKQVASQELFAELAALVENSTNRSPVPVRCTRKLFTNLTNHVDTTIVQKQYENLCTILSALRYIVNGSPTPTTGFPKFLSFGLPKKISAWCTSLCLTEPGVSQTWRNAADDLLFTLALVIDFSDDSKQAMLPVLPVLLQCISQPFLPGPAKIEATRGSNSLLEAGDMKYKTALVRMEETKALLVKMDELVQKAGDFELQVTTLECLFRLTAVAERIALANRWFNGLPSLLEAFNFIREAFFEVDCRRFLNLLNENCGHNRTVYSIPCKRAFLGSFELHQPSEEGLDEFWVDFNTTTNSMSLYTEDMCALSNGGGGGGGGGADDMWESVIVKNDIIQEWSVTSAHAELSLSITLTVPAHSLLRSLPSSTSRKICITFDVDSDPLHPLKCVFGSAKQARPAPKAVSWKGGSETRNVKRSVAIVPIHLRPKFTGLKEGEAMISPIEPANTASPGGSHIISSQGSATPPNQNIPPIATPATSTPKPHPLALYGAPPSSSGGRRRPLEFVSGGSGGSKQAHKASQSVSGIVLGKNSRVVQRAPPVNSLNIVKDTVAPSKVRSTGGKSEGDASLSTHQETHKPAEDAKKEGGAPARTVAQAARMTGNRVKGNTPRRNGPASQAPAQAATEKVIAPPVPAATRKKDGGASRVPRKAENTAKKGYQSPAETARAAKKSAVQQEEDTSGDNTATSKKVSAQIPAKAVPTANDRPQSSSRKDKSKSTTSRKNSSRDAMQPHTSTEMATKPPPGPTAKGKGKPLSTKDRPLTRSRVSASVKATGGGGTVRSAQKVLPAEEPSKLRSKAAGKPPGKAPPRDSLAVHSKAAVAPRANITVPSVNTGETAASVYDDFMDTSGYVRGDSTSPSNTYTIPLKPVDEAASSAAFKKQHNSSLSSVGSNRSRTALADISNAYLNRGGQRRVFNLSAMTKKNGRKKPRKAANSSNCTSLNSSVNSEVELKAIPDSLPLNTTQTGRGKAVTGAAKQTQSSSGKRRRKRSCVVPKDDESDSDDDSSWEVSPPKQKRSKRAPAAAKPKVGAKGRKLATAAGKGERSKVILTSARTKNKLCVPQSSFDLTEYDFDQEFSEKSVRERAKAKHSRSPVSSVFSELRKKGPRKEGQGSGWGKTGKTVEPLASPLDVSRIEKERTAHRMKADTDKIQAINPGQDSGRGKPGKTVSASRAEKEHAAHRTKADMDKIRTINPGQDSRQGKPGETVEPLASVSRAEKAHRVKADTKKRAIYDLYDPDFSPPLSPVAADSETSKRHSRAPSRPSLLDAPKRQGSSKNTGPRNGPTATPRSRTASGEIGKGFPKRSGPAASFPARALLKEFEEEGESEEEEGGVNDGSTIKSLSTSRKHSRGIEVAEEDIAPVQSKKRRTDSSASTSRSRSPNAVPCKGGESERSTLTTTTRPRGQNAKRNLDESTVEPATRPRGRSAEKSLEGSTVESAIRPRGRNAERNLEGSTVDSVTRPRDRSARSTEGDLEDSAQACATRSKGHKTEYSTTVLRSRSVEFARGGQRDSTGRSSIESGLETAAQSRKCKPSLEPGSRRQNSLLEDSAHEPSLEPADGSRKLSSGIQWEDSVPGSGLDSADRSRKRILEEQIPSAPKKQPRRSSGYSSYHSSRQSADAGSDVSINSIASDDPPHGEGGFESPHVSPASSPQLPRPSQVGADEGVTKSFAEICQSLVSRSGKKGPVATKERETKAIPQVSAKKSSKTQPSTQKRKNIASASPSLTQISRNIVNSHYLGNHIEAMSSVDGDVESQEQRERREFRGRVKAVDDPDSTLQSEAEVDSTIGSSVVRGPTRGLDSIPLATSIPAPPLEAATAAAPRHVSSQSHVTPSYSSDEEGSGSSEDTRLHNISTEMQALMTTIRQSLSSARKNKTHRKKPSSSIAKRVPEDLEDLWEDHHEDRSSVLRAYKHQLALELAQLEKEVTRNRAAESEVTAFLQKKLSDLTKSRQFQQSQLDRLQALQKTFDDQLNSLEETHSEQKANSQQLLEKDMNNLRKKVLAENQRHEVERVQRALQVMLLHM